MNLAGAFNSEKNSLTFLRFFLASLVVFSHAYALGGFRDDPLRPFQISFGEIAVEGFFAISGFLIMCSFLKSYSVRHYLWKRFLRIFPAFWICLLLTTFVLSPIIYFIQNRTFVNLSIFKNPFFEYARANFFLFIRQEHLQGIFLLNPKKEILNGSLWTLFPEFLCYLTVPLLGALFSLKNQKKSLLVLFFLLLLINNFEGGFLGYFNVWRLEDKLWRFFELRRLFCYFFAGVLLFLYRDNIPFNTRILIVAILLFILSVYLKIYNFIGPLLLAYILIGLSVKLPFSYFGKDRDYSYGLYIYAFPVQQTIYFLNGKMEYPIMFFIMSMAVTMIPAFLSWHFVEKPCLRMKNIFLNNKGIIV